MRLAFISLLLVAGSTAMAADEIRLITSYANGNKPTLVVSSQGTCVNFGRVGLLAERPITFEVISNERAQNSIVLLRLVFASPTPQYTNKECHDFTKLWWRRHVSLDLTRHPPGTKVQVLDSNHTPSAVFTVR